MMENVKNLVGCNHKENFLKFLTYLESLGYKNSWAILNARDYGIPQNRERLFCIGFRRQTDFIFPEPINLEYKMYDFLLDTFDSSYFLTDKGVKFVTSHKNREKRYTQINGDIALCQKRNQEFNWHGDFVYHPLTQGEEAYD